MTKILSSRFKCLKKFLTSRCIRIMSKIMDYIQRYYYNFIVIAVMMTDIRIYSKICLFAGIILEFTALDQRFQFDEIWLSERQTKLEKIESLNLLQSGQFNFFSGIRNFPNFRKSKPPKIHADSGQLNSKKSIIKCRKRQLPIQPQTYRHTDCVYFNNNLGIWN